MTGTSVRCVEVHCMPLKTWCLQRHAMYLLFRITIRTQCDRIAIRNMIQLFPEMNCLCVLQLLGVTECSNRIAISFTPASKYFCKNITRFQNFLCCSRRGQRRVHLHEVMHCVVQSQKMESYGILFRLNSNVPIHGTLQFQISSTYLNSCLWICVCKQSPSIGHLTLWNLPRVFNTFRVHQQVVTISQVYHGQVVRVCNSIKTNYGWYFIHYIPSLHCRVNFSGHILPDSNKQYYAADLKFF